MQTNNFLYSLPGLIFPVKLVFNETKQDCVEQEKDAAPCSDFGAHRPNATHPSNGNQGSRRPGFNGNQPWNKLPFNLNRPVPLPSGTNSNKTTETPKPLGG